MQDLSFGVKVVDQTKYALLNRVNAAVFAESHPVLDLYS